MRKLRQSSGERVYLADPPEHVISSHRIGDNSRDWRRWGYLSFRRWSGVCCRTDMLIWQGRTAFLVVSIYGRKTLWPGVLLSHNTVIEYLLYACQPLASKSLSYRLSSFVDIDVVVYRKRLNMMLCETRLRENGADTADQVWDNVTAADCLCIYYVSAVNRKKNLRLVRAAHV